MRKKRVSEDKELRYRIYTRVNESKYKELTSILEGNPRNDMSSLLRSIIYNRRIIVFTKDRTLDTTMEELSRLRSEIRSIGVNINQITKYFNTYPEAHRKKLYAAMAFKEYLAIESKADALLQIIEKLAERWLSGSRLEDRSGGHSATMKGK